MLQVSRRKQHGLKQAVDCVGNEARTPCPKTLFPVIGFDTIFLCSLGATEITSVTNIVGAAVRP